MSRAFTNFVQRYDRLDNWLDKGNLVLSTRESTIRMPETVNFLMERFNSENDAVRLAIARAIARVHFDESPPVIYETLMRAIKEPGAIQKDYNQLSYIAADALVDALMGLCFFRTKRDNTVNELISELDKHSRFVGAGVAHALLYARFQLDPPQPLDPADLTEDQREVLRAIAASRRPWALNGNMEDSLNTFGLPTNRAEFVQFLAKSDEAARCPAVRLNID